MSSVGYPKILLLVDNRSDGCSDLFDKFDSRYRDRYNVVPTHSVLDLMSDMSKGEGRVEEKTRDSFISIFCQLISKFLQ